MRRPHIGVREARLALLAALVACAINMLLVAVWDPFGFQETRADTSARKAAALVLCTQVFTYEQLLAQPGPDTPVRQAVQGGLDRQREAERVLGIQCPKTSP